MPSAGERSAGPGVFRRGHSGTRDRLRSGPARSGSIILPTPDYPDTPTSRTYNLPRTAACDLEEDRLTLTLSLSFSLSP